MGVETDIPRVPDVEDEAPLPDSTRRPPVGDRLPPSPPLRRTPGRQYRVPPGLRLPGNGAGQVRVESGWTTPEIHAPNPWRNPEDEGRRWLPEQRRYETPGEARSRQASEASRNRNGGTVDLDEWLRKMGQMF